MVKNTISGIIIIAVLWAAGCTDKVLLDPAQEAPSIPQYRPILGSANLDSIGKKIDLAWTRSTDISDDSIFYYVVYRGVQIDNMDVLDSLCRTWVITGTGYVIGDTDAYTDQDTVFSLSINPDDSSADISLIVDSYTLLDTLPTGDTVYVPVIGHIAPETTFGDLNIDFDPEIQKPFFDLTYYYQVSIVKLNGYEGRKSNTLSIPLLAAPQTEE